MFRFEHTIAFWLFTLIIFMLILFLIFKNNKKKRLNFWAKKNLIKSQFISFSNSKDNFKFILQFLTLVFLVIAIANPQMGSKLQKVKRKGSDIIIALDLSISMNAEDLKPSRLELAKRSISKFIDNLHGDRIGIIVFAGHAYVQLPITTDYAAAKMFLNTIGTDIIPTQGTAIAEAINLALESFDLKASTTKAIIIISDGEDHQGNVIEAANEAAEKGILVHTIGMGTIQGAPIPVYKGRKQIGFKKDKDGNVVVTKMNEEMLREIASAGNGIYVRANQINVGLNYLLKKIAEMQKKEIETKVFTDYDDYFQPFISIAILLLVIDILIPYKRSKLADKINNFISKQ